MNASPLDFLLRPSARHIDNLLEQCVWRILRSRFSQIFRKVNHSGDVFFPPQVRVAFQVWLLSGGGLSAQSLASEYVNQTQGVLYRSHGVNIVVCQRHMCWQYSVHMEISRAKRAK